MPDVPETPAGPKTKPFGQLCVLFIGVGVVASVVAKSLWPLVVFAAAVYLVAVYTNRFERRDAAADPAPTEPRRGRRAVR